MNKALISLGSNVRGRKEILDDTLAYLKQKGTLVVISSCYETPADGYKMSPPYLNCVLQMITPAGYETLKSGFKQREAEAGRTPESKSSGIIPLDIDIVIWNDRIMKPDDMKQDYMKQGLNEIGW